MEIWCRAREKQRKRRRYAKPDPDSRFRGAEVIPEMRQQELRGRAYPREAPVPACREDGPGRRRR